MPPPTLTELGRRDCPAGIPGWAGPVAEAGPFAAAGEGGGPVVRLPDGHQFYAFEPAFRGGVRLAAADLTGDGSPDVVAAPGPGGGPVVAAFDGRTGAELFRTFAFDPSFRGGLTVAATADAIAAAPGVGGGPVYARLDLHGALIDTTLAGDPDARGGLRVESLDASTLSVAGFRVDPNPLFGDGGLWVRGQGYSRPGDPLPPAVSSGPAFSTHTEAAGTLTGYVRDDRGTLYGLSNDHVLAGSVLNHLYRGPARAYRTGDGAAVGETVARTPTAVEMPTDSALYLDADGVPDMAHAQPGAGGRTVYHRLTRPPREDPPVPGEPVYVWTRFGVVRAEVQATGGTFYVGLYLNGVQASFPGQVSLRPGPDGDAPAVPGYSGSLITDRQGRPLAQLWGGQPSTGLAVATPIQVVLDTMAGQLGRPLAWVA